MSNIATSSGRAKVASLREFIDAPGVKNQLAMALPKSMTPDRFVRSVITLVQQTPSLLDCTQQSILAGMFQAAELGLDLSMGLGHAYLVPRSGQARMTIGYKGLIELAYRSERLRSFEARTVYRGDVFRVLYGTDKKIIHEPNFTDPGEAIAYYAVVHFANGGFDFEIMTHAQVQEHRVKFSASKGGPWATNFDEMARKTVIKKLAKRLPLSTDFLRAVHLDDMVEVEDYRSQVQQTRQQQAVDYSGGGEVIEGEVEDPQPQSESK